MASAKRCTCATPDDNGVELYWDRPKEKWPRTSDGKLAMVTERLDLKDLLRELETRTAEPAE
jgi:catechol-2,3-dioxygenase